jgi:hypothetical protein
LPFIVAPCPHFLNVFLDFFCVYGFRVSMFAFFLRFVCVSFAFLVSVFACPRFCDVFLRFFRVFSRFRFSCFRVRVYFTFVLRFFRVFFAFLVSVFSCPRFFCVFIALFYVFFAFWVSVFPCPRLCSRFFRVSICVRVSGYVLRAFFLRFRDVSGRKKNIWKPGHISGPMKASTETRRAGRRAKHTNTKPRQARAPPKGRNQNPGTTGSDKAHRRSI